MHQKGLAPILIVLLIAVALGVGGYFVYTNYLQYGTKTNTPAKTPQPSPEIALDESGQYYVYTNQNRTYTFKFPKSWIFEENSAFVLDPGDTILFPPEEKEKENLSTFVRVSLNKPDFKTEEESNREEEVQFNTDYNLQPSSGHGQRRYKIANTTVSGLRAVQIINRTLPGDPTETYYSLSTKFRYGIASGEVSFSGDKGIVDKYLTDYQLILDSFKVLGPEPTLTPITLKDFQHPRLGFSLKYPSNWLINSFQNKGYDSGIVIVNNRDVELITMYDTNPPIFSACEVNPSPDKLNIQIGQQNILVKKIKVDEYYGCEILKVKTKSGKQFNMELKFFGTKDEKQALELLKSTSGLTLVK